MAHHNLVSSHWLASHLHDDTVVILDCTWHLPTLQRQAMPDYLSAHIPRAQFFDLDAHSDLHSPLPHMLPTAECFTEVGRQFGVTPASHVICYDQVGLFSAARVWWMFKAFGHKNVSVLDGGLPQWQANGYATTNGLVPQHASDQFIAQLIPAYVSDRRDVEKASQIIDARSSPRFRGEEPEPRKDVRPGHMPGAFNIHYAQLLQHNGTLKDLVHLRQIFENAGVKLDSPLITSCGSGVTAAIIFLALELLGAEKISLYDGSWAEWGAAPDTAIATGA